jgi:hypothetical protein
MKPLPVSELITDLDVQALVDSHLSVEEESRVWNAIIRSPALETYYKKIVIQKKLLKIWWENEGIKEFGTFIA